MDIVAARKRLATVLARLDLECLRGDTRHRLDVLRQAGHKAFFALQDAGSIGLRRGDFLAALEAIKADLAQEIPRGREEFFEESIAAIDKMYSSLEANALESASKSRTGRHDDERIA